MVIVASNRYIFSLYEFRKLVGIYYYSDGPGWLSVALWSLGDKTIHYTVESAYGPEPATQLTSTDHNPTQVPQSYLFGDRKGVLCMPLQRCLGVF